MSENILASNKTNRAILKLGLPMILSMVLQALYNVVDTAFVINMGADGQSANLALTYAFPIQILMIAVRVGRALHSDRVVVRQVERSKAVGRRCFDSLIF